MLNSSTFNKQYTLNDKGEMTSISSVETKKDRKAAQAHADEHFEHMSAKARLMDINRKRTQRKIENLET